MAKRYMRGLSAGSPPDVVQDIGKAVREAGARAIRNGGSLIDHFPSALGDRNLRIARLDNPAAEGGSVPDYNPAEAVEDAAKIANGLKSQLAEHLPWAMSQHGLQIVRLRAASDNENDDPDEWI